MRTDLWRRLLPAVAALGLVAGLSATSAQAQDYDRDHNGWREGGHEHEWREHHDRGWHDRAWHEREWREHHEHAWYGGNYYVAPPPPVEYVPPPPPPGLALGFSFR